MSTVCGRPQEGEGGPAHVDACGQGGGGDQKRDFFVDVINGWPQSMKRKDSESQYCYYQWPKTLYNLDKNLKVIRKIQ